MTSLAAQLSRIAAESKSSLDVKAKRNAHSKSLLFEPRVAAGQTFQAIYSICHEGFEELCQLDGRFTEFSGTLFSSASQEEDRTLMTPAENERLDTIVESFLQLVGSRLRLLPAVKALEWLIRRFRIHEFNTGILLTTFLPYHSIPAFVTLMSILPAKLPQEYAFLDPYVRSLTSPPRAAIIQTTTARPELLSVISRYTLECCRRGRDCPALISFWGGVMVQTVNGMLDKMRSGRKAVQLENDQTVMAQIIPTLSECLVLKDVPGVQIASYMVVTILAAKGDFQDSLLSAFMKQIIQGWSSDVVRPALVCLCILAQHRPAKQMSGRIAKALLEVQDLTKMLAELRKDYRVDKLANGLALALIDRLEKKGDIRSLALASSIVSENLLEQGQIKVVYKSLLLAAHRIDDNFDKDGQIRKQLSHDVVHLARLDDGVGEVVRKTIEEVDFNIEELELKLDVAIRLRPAIEQPEEDVAKDGAVVVADEHQRFCAALDRLSKQGPSTSSCLYSSPGDVFDDLCSTFLMAAADAAALSQLDSSPILSRIQAHTTPMYFSFYLRIACGPYPALARAMALQQVKSRLKDVECSGVDVQAVIPYVIAALSDPTRKVRRAAADLVTVLNNLYLLPGAAQKSRWGSSGLYSEQGDLTWMEPDHVKVLCQHVLNPALEECVLDENHVSSTLKDTLEACPPPEDAEADRKSPVSRTIRLSILQFLSSHIVCSPLLSVKVRLLRVVNQVSKVGSTKRTDLLLPVLRWWASFSAGDARQLVDRDRIDEARMDEACAAVVIAKSEKGVAYLFDLIGMPRIVERRRLLECIFGQFRRLWPSMKKDMQFSVSQRMLELCQFEPEPLLPKIVAVEAAEVLRNVDLTTAVLASFLNSTRDSIKAAIEQPVSKRRRVGSPMGDDQSGRPVAKASPELETALNKTTFILELVQDCNPATHPELIESLFMILAELQKLRAVAGSELGYLQNIALSSLLSMMPQQKDALLAAGASVMHGDILAACIQKSASPAVINTALLLVASLARTAPDVVLHSVMPILTFMGSSVLRQADDYSAHVVNQTIKEVIPPLIDTFRKKRRNLVASTAELLSSFVVAYEHIPPHRKHDTFVLLIQNLGPDDFLFALMAMFVDKYGTTDNGLAFLMKLMASFSVEIQLRSLVKLLDLVADLFKPKPALSAALLGKHEAGELEADKGASKIASRELTLVAHLLANRHLKKKMSQLCCEDDDMEAAKIRDQFAVLLESLLTLADTVKTNKGLHARCGDALSSMLDLLSTAEFIKSVETLLDRSNVTLRQKVLRLLEVRVDKANMADGESRAALLAFLPQLTAVIRESDDMIYKQTAVVCVDKIAEKYGKKDLDAVAAAAETIAGEQCLGQPFPRLRIMALLCLASLVDVLQDGIVPVLPTAVPTALSYLKESLGGETQDLELHNAGFAFVTAVAQHLPYMISGAYLDQLLGCCCQSAAQAPHDVEAKKLRLGCMQFLALLADAKVLFTALAKNWPKVSDAGPVAVNEYLQLLGMAIEKHAKAAIARNAPALSTLFLGGLDFRRESTNSEVSDEVQGTLNEVALKMIYKLNDATFRPIFSQLMEWAASGLPKKDVAGRRLRLESVFSFLSAFFDKLKSIVTSYGSYVVDVAVQVLRETDLNQPEQRELWRRVLLALTPCLEHDQDGFWRTPAHFHALAPVLVDQLRAAAAAGIDVLPELVPAVVELAAAADAKEHHREVNGSLLRLLRADGAGGGGSGPAVRQAVVRCQQALTRRLGEEWLQALPEMLPYISELQDDDDDDVERENRRWMVIIEDILGESLDSMLQ